MLHQLIQENTEAFVRIFEQAPLLTAAAPGRINLIGEHTDYNQGLCLASAIDRWVLVSIARRPDSLCKVVSGNYETVLEFELGNVIQSREKWHPIVTGITSLLHQQYHISSGFNAYIWGNVPLGSGVSSSAAIEVALANALRSTYQLPFSDKELVLLCQQTEHTFLGVKSGLLDQYTSQFSRANYLLKLDFNAIDHELIPSEISGYSWILVNTMVHRELSGSKYSERVAETQEAFQLIQELHPEVSCFRDIKLYQVSEIENKILRNRIRHYVEENNRVEAFIKAIQQKQIAEAGRLLTASHASLQHAYEVSCEELDFLAEQANFISGCVGSRMMGGGFGGCTINLVKKEKAEDFSEKIFELYLKKFGLKTEINHYQLVSGAEVRVSTFIIQQENVDSI